MAFRVPDDTEPRATRFWIDEDGQKWRSLGNACWFTNVDYAKRHDHLILVHRYAGNESKYPRYDNYDAIEVSKVKEIPLDYEGVMGVPITFLDKHAPGQFEIVGRVSNEGVDVVRTKVYSTDECKKAYEVLFGKPGTYDLNASSVLVGRDGVKKKTYNRILIRNLFPDEAAMAA